MPFAVKTLIGIAKLHTMAYKPYDKWKITMSFLPSNPSHCLRYLCYSPQSAAHNAEAVNNGLLFGTTG